MPYMTRIPSDLARFGLEVELVPGWETRGSTAFAPAGVTCHWTAGPRGTKARPSLNICTNGRPGIPGPLCNIYLARDGVCVVVAAGRANHAGVGGFRGLVGNSAVYGIEAESGGDGDWTDAQRAAYPRLVAALLSGIGRDASWAHGHHEWAPTRKIDVRDIMPAIRSGAAAILANPIAPAPEEDDMTPDQAAKLDRIHFELTNQFPSRVPGSKVKETAVGFILNTDAATYQSLQLDRAQTGALNALAKLVADQNGLTVEDVRRVVSEEIAKGVDVDVTVAPGS